MKMKATSHRRKAQPKARKARPKTHSRKKWSGSVTRNSDALDLENGVFTKSPRAMALSLKRSAEQSHRRKSPPYRSAMSMLTFYMNRGGKNLSSAQRAKLEKAKTELRKIFRK
jgi:hypothetical protein